MKCVKPYTNSAGDSFGCGQCINCRIDKKRMWTLRLYLESMNPANAEPLFITLTYNQENLPPGDNLVPDDLAKYIKSVRSKHGAFRYYACGEYGEKTGRAHYHLIAYPSRYTNINGFKDEWKYGFVQCGRASQDAMAYVAGYVTKKLGSQNKDRDDGRTSEFARMSRRPGIGFNAVQPIIDMYQTRGGAEYIARHGDISATVQINGKPYPMGRTIRDKVRQALDIPLRKIDRIALNPNAAVFPEHPNEQELDMRRQRAAITIMDQRNLVHRRSGHGL